MLLLKHPPVPLPRSFPTRKEKKLEKSVGFADRSQDGTRSALYWGNTAAEPPLHRGGGKTMQLRAVWLHVGEDASSPLFFFPGHFLPPTTAKEPAAPSGTAPSGFRCDEIRGIRLSPRSLYESGTIASVFRVPPHKTRRKLPPLARKAPLADRPGGLRWRTTIMIANRLPAAPERRRKPVNCEKVPASFMDRS